MEKKRANVAQTSDAGETAQRDGECVLRIAGVTGSPTGGGRTVGCGAEKLHIAAGFKDAALSS
jgi:hypothetical protein